MKILLISIFQLLGLCICIEAINPCDEGWFGSRCQFNCHCSKNLSCTEYGLCHMGDRCEKGWFGPSCQYQDLTTLKDSTVTINPQHDTSLLIDGDDNTCIRDRNTITVEFKESYPLTWLRLVGFNMEDVNLQFKNKHTDDEFLGQCHNKTVFKSYKQKGLTDIFCVSNGTAAVVQITWKRETSSTYTSVCSFYISGGRNVALKQSASQSSTSGNSSASLAVDGNNIDFSAGSCSETEQAVHSGLAWTVLFDLPQLINRIVIYNRNGSQDRLSNFVMTVNTSDAMFHFIDTSSQSQQLYTLTLEDLLNATNLSISVTNTDNVLSLCEVEIYGVTLCPSGTYGIECQHACHCAQESDVCHSETGVCDNRCATGYMGESCEINCHPGRPLSEECYPPCSENCVDLQCNRITGKCLAGCNDQIIETAPECLPGCSEGMFGTNCNFKCHCKDNKCQQDGRCEYGSLCELGWFGTGCQYQDLTVDAVIKTSPSRNSKLITDGDDATCILELENIQVNLTRSFLFMWMRLSVLEPDSQLSAFVQLIDSSTGVTINCTDMLENHFDRRTTDIYCESNTTVTYINVTLKEPRSVCSMFISGGRNVAYMQYTYQSTNYKNWPLRNTISSNAVDGSYSYDGEYCARTDVEDTDPYWAVQFETPRRIFRYNIHNGLDAVGYRNGFILISCDENYIPIFNYTVIPVNDMEELAVIHTPNRSQLVSYIKIVPVDIGFETKGQINVCEVEAFGDSSCPRGKFGPVCTDVCNCHDRDEACLVTTGGCRSGCAAGFYGEGCQTQCVQGLWGIDCLNRCSDACLSGQCDRINGACI